MGAKKTAGFTIVEVILVLAVTGMMMVGVLVGSAAQVRQQEYRDSVHSLQSEVQRQYSLVQNPTIDRTPDDSKTTCGITTTTQRGASDNCFVVGRLLSSSNGTDISETPILGQSPGGNSSQPIIAGGPRDTANGWKLYINQTATAHYTVSWGSRIQPTDTNAGGAKQFNILLIMSPADGSVRTYAERAPVIADPSQLYGLLASSTTLNLCVTGGSGTIFGDPMAVQLPAAASSAASIRIPPQSDGVCHGA